MYEFFLEIHDGNQSFFALSIKIVGVMVVLPLNPMLFHTIWLASALYGRIIKFPNILRVHDITHINKNRLNFSEI